MSTISAFYCEGNVCYFFGSIFFCKCENDLLLLNDIMFHNIAWNSKIVVRFCGKVFEIISISCRLSADK